MVETGQMVVALFDPTAAPRADGVNALIAEGEGEVLATTRWWDYSRVWMTCACVVFAWCFVFVKIVLCIVFVLDMVVRLFVLCAAFTLLLRTCPARQGAGGSKETA